MHMWYKMAGNQNSGRKKDPMSEYSRMGKKTLYIRQTTKNGKDWVDDPIFQWFKRHHGKHWQTMVRQYMKWDVSSWREKSFWRCTKCPNTGLLGNYVSRKQPKCPTCGQWQNDIMKMRYG